MLLRRFAGLVEQPKIVTKTMTLVIPMCRGIIVEPVDIDAGVYHRLKLLLEEACKYRRPPQDLLDKIKQEAEMLRAPVEELVHQYIEDMFSDVEFMED